MVWWTNSNFLGWRMLLRQCYLCQKRCGCLSRVEIFYCYKGLKCYEWLLILQFHWSLPLFGNKPKKFDFVHQTVSSWEACIGWARVYSLFSSLALLSSSSIPPPSPLSGLSPSMIWHVWMLPCTDLWCTRWYMVMRAVTVLSSPEWSNHTSVTSWIKLLLAALAYSNDRRL